VLPETLPPTYVRFLGRQSGKQDWQLAGIRETCRRAAGGGTWGRPCRAPLKALRGTSFENVAVALPCEFCHPGQTCWGHAVAQVAPTCLRALPVYLPLYLVPLPLVHRAALLGPRGPEILLRALVGAARSSAFLASLFGLAWTGACGWGGQSGLGMGFTGPGLAASAWVAGLSLLVEKPSRRVELTLYVVARAVESLALVLDRLGTLPPWLLRRARIDVWAFSVGAGCVLQAYSGDGGRHRHAFRSKYINVLDFILGNSGADDANDAGIRHVPSTPALVGLAASRVASHPALARLRSSGSLAALAGLAGVGGGGGARGGENEEGTATLTREVEARFNR